MKNYGIRNKTTKEVTARFEDPIEAKYHIKEPENEEVVEKELENIYETFPDGKTYITGVKEHWTPYKI